MLRLAARLTLVVACGFFVSGCGQGAAAEAPVDPCHGCGLPLGRMNEHFGSPERMVYPAVAELVAGPLQALGFESQVTEGAAKGLSFAKGDGIKVEFAQTLPDASRPRPAFERWLGDLRMTAYADGDLDPKLRALFECTCSAAAGAARDDLTCTSEPEVAVRLAAEQCRETSANQRTFVSAGNGADLSSVSGTEKLDPIEQERSCMQTFWLERGKISFR